MKLGQNFFKYFVQFLGKAVSRIFFLRFTDLHCEKNCPSSNYWIRNDPKNINSLGIFGSSYMTDYQCTANSLSNFKSLSRSLKQFFLTVGQINFGN